MAEPTIVLDVRRPDEFARGHVDGAINWDVTSTDPPPAFPKDSQLLLYCRSGGRAGRAQEIYHQMGYTDVTNLGSLEEAIDYVSKSNIR